MKGCEASDRITLLVNMLADSNETTGMALLDVLDVVPVKFLEQSMEKGTLNFHHIFFHG